MWKKLVFFTFFLLNGFSQSPFQIDFEKRGRLTLEDLAIIEEKLREIDLKPLLMQIYQGRHSDSPMFDQLFSRCSRGINWKFRSDQIPPDIILHKINKGGDNCIVTAVSCSGDYVKMQEKQKNFLKRSGFNGYYLVFRGAIPNPEGLGAKYIGTPYAFKFLGLLEAQNLGFNQVLWADSSLLFLKNPEPLFKEIKKNHGYIHFYSNGDAGEQRYLLNATVDAVKNVLDVDLRGPASKHTGFVAAGLHGFKIDTPIFDAYKKLFLLCLVDGFPFLSFSPDEFVMQAILSKPEFFELVKASKTFKKTGRVLHERFDVDIFQAKKEGYMLFLQPHIDPITHTYR